MQTPQREQENWRVWDSDVGYGRRLQARATGEAAEMESSKALASMIEDDLVDGRRVLDVGCGAGHYLRSLRRLSDADFFYTGVDATSEYVSLAREAWKKDDMAAFEVGDIFDLPLDNAAFDTVICNNVLQHLPSIAGPISELIRVGRHRVVIRAMFGPRMFRIQEVYSRETHPELYPGSAPEMELTEEGYPHHFHFFNVYSFSYLEKLLGANTRVEEWSISEDNAFSPEAILRDADQDDAPPDATVILGGQQVNGVVLQPWHFVDIRLGPA